MKTVMMISALALLAAGCASSHDVRMAKLGAINASVCPEKSRVYNDSGKFVSCRQAGALTEQAQNSTGQTTSHYRYGGNTSENVRNTSYQRVYDEEAYFGNQAKQ